jgi:hypothetical protein
MVEENLHGERFNPIISLINESNVDNLPTENKFINQKFINDIEKGFKITRTEQVSKTRHITIEAVTRAGDDLFFIQTTFVSDSKALGDGYSRFSCEVRRRKALPGEKGAATLEVWKMQCATLCNQNSKLFRVQPENGGNLDEKEFWGRYNASIVDAEKTREFFEIRKREEIKTHAKCKTWKITFEENLKQEQLPLN